jgi:hypothetical protein
MLAACLLARAGESVRLLDEQTKVGGHLTYDHYTLPGGDGSSADLLNELEAALVRSGAALSLESVVWGAFQTESGFELAVNRNGVQETLSCSRVIFATGTTDRAIPVPGATLPGVMTARAARILGERHGVVPGERFAIVGPGPQADRLARDIGSWGARVEVVVRADSLRRISGHDCVQAIESADGVTDVDVVVLAAGEHPDLQLPGMVGVERLFDATLGGWRPQLPNGATDAFVAGGAALGGAWINDVLASAVDAVSLVSPADVLSKHADLAVVAQLVSNPQERQP